MPTASCCSGKNRNLKLEQKEVFSLYLSIVYTLRSLIYQIGFLSFNYYISVFNLTSHCCDKNTLCVDLEQGIPLQYL